MVKMDPIRSELKSRRIKWDKDTSAVNWAWLKEVRENNPTRRIYEENPYAEVYTFRENMYGIFTENADGHTDVWSYLILGPEKAMLIDTSFGIGNFKALADRLSGGREVIVANTHASYDHSYGNAWFDKAYCHKYIAPLMKTNQNPHIWDYLFDENGKVVPVTVIEAGPCTVVQKKTVESDGYEAVQLGFGEVSAKKVNKAAKGHFDKADVAPKRTLREFRLDDISGMNVGDILKADVFAAGDKVDVIGTSKGKGYQGVIKRFGQHRLRESHGTGPVARHAGSNGSTSTPSRVFKGKRLPGHMGAVRVTVQNLSVVKVDAKNNLIAIKGAIPGPKGSVVCVSDSVKA